MLSSARHITRIEHILGCFVPGELCREQLQIRSWSETHQITFFSQILLETHWLPNPTWYYKYSAIYNEDDFPVGLTSYGSFFLTANEGMVPSFWVSAQWKIFWYSVGSDNWEGIMVSNIQSTQRCYLWKTDRDVCVRGRKRGEVQNKYLPIWRGSYD